MKPNKLLILALAVSGLLLGSPAAHASPALDLAKQLNQAFIEVADKVSPSVVVIDVTQRPVVANYHEDGPAWEMLPPALRRHFREQYDAPTPETQGQGSGVIIREDGFILTNRHVVEDASRIEVRLKDGRRFKAEIRGTDPQSDVAVLKIDAKDLPAAKLGDSAQTRVGEFAIAIGAPFRLDYSVTFGHISGKGRHAILGEEGMGMDQDFLQTDANINPGNSGGPLVNINGEVVGINTLIRGMRTGIGFAIPSNLAREVADKLIADGKFTRVWLGISIRSLAGDAELKDAFPGLKEGVVVMTIEPSGPAAKSELRPADVITAVDGVPVTTVQQLRNEVRRKQSGQSVALDVSRNGKSAKVKVPVAAREADNSPETQPVSVRPEETNIRLGLNVQTLTHELADQFQTPMARGVIVTEVERRSIADGCDLRPGDIITEVDHKPVGDPKEFRGVLKDADLKKGVIVNLVSGNARRFVILRTGDE